MNAKVIDIKAGNVKRMAGFGYTEVRLLCGTFTFSNSYVSGGEPCPIDEYIGSLMGVVIESRGGHIFTYDRATRRIVAYDTRTGHNHGHAIEAVQEIIAVVENTGTLSHKDIVLNAVATVGVGKGPKKIVGKENPVTAGLVRVGPHVEGAGTPLTFAPEDGVQEAEVTYLRTATSNSSVNSAPGSEVKPGTDLSVLGALHWLAWGV